MRLKTVAVAAVVAAGVALAPAANADPYVSQDDQFYALLYSYGIHPHWNAVAAAYTVCQLLSVGYGYDEVAREVYRLNAITLDAADVIVASAAAVYCPGVLVGKGTVA